MMSYQFYLLLHLLGIGALFFALGGLFLHAINGGTKETNVMRKPTSIMHGVALFLILLSGFGMLARIGGSTSDLWVLLKVLIWVVMGAAIMIPLRAQKLARPLWYAVPLVLVLAGWVVSNKPGDTSAERAEQAAVEAVEVDAAEAQDLDGVDAEPADADAAYVEDSDAEPVDADDADVEGADVEIAEAEDVDAQDAE